MLLQSAFRLRRQAEQALARGRYAEAAALFRREAAARRAMGDFGGAKAEEIKADRYTSDLRLFAHLPG